jgi:F-type H+-transporting ATPase subunit delta
MKAADKTLSKRYARAYMALDGAAFNKHGDAAARARIEELEKVRNAASQFRRLFLHPLVGYDNKNEILAKLLAGGQPADKALMSSQAAVFVRLLLKENRFYLLETVLEDCMQFYNAYAGIAHSEVVSRHPLSEEESGHVVKVLSAATGKKVLVTRIVSERVVGGMEIRLGDLIIDGTVKGRLERLKKTILSF